MSSSAQSIKKVSLELGGKSPLIVFDDVDIDQAIEWIMFGVPFIHLFGNNILDLL